MSTCRTGATSTWPLKTGWMSRNATTSSVAQHHGRVQGARGRPGRPRRRAALGLAHPRTLPPTGRAPLAGSNTCSIIVRSMPTSVAPPGWPDNVRPPGAPDWDRTAVAYLFDCCPADFRGYRVLRHHPLVLAQFAEHFVEGQCRAVQDGLAVGPHVAAGPGAARRGGDGGRDLAGAGRGPDADPAGGRPDRRGPARAHVPGPAVSGAAGGAGCTRGSCASLARWCRCWPARPAA